MDLHLVRYSYALTETEGLLYAPPLLPIFTMEQPWVRSAAYPSGEPFKSCVPEGTYELRPYRRNNERQHEVWCLVNEDLGVYFTAADRTADNQRFKCLIHSGNVVAHTQGCILPGNRRGFLREPTIQRAVLESGHRSGYAMDRLHKLLGPMSSGHTLTISQEKGARYE